MELSTEAMPPKVASAITAVMSEVPKLQKTEKNSHGNYNFASIDDFLEAVRPLCAKHGLIISQDEEDFELRENGIGRDGKPISWLIVRFAFTLAHSSGETWAHRPRRTIMVQATMGSQAFGAAQSYCLKQFERSLFQIATGEKGQDADEHAPADLPTQTTPREKNSRSIDWKGPLTKTQLQTKGREIVREIESASDLDELEAFWGSKDVVAVLDQMKADIPEWFDKDDNEFQGLKQRFMTRRLMLQTPIAAE